MLCGAADVRDYSNAFSQVVRDIGGEPVMFFDGSNHHLNLRRHGWRSNSLQSTGKADLCVFVVNRAYGHLTWRLEMESLLETGRPFILMVFEETWKDYKALERLGGRTSDIGDANKRELLNAMSRAERQDELTFITFDTANFSGRLREASAMLLDSGLQAIQAAGELERQLRAAEEYRLTSSRVQYEMQSRLLSHESVIVDLQQRLRRWDTRHRRVDWLRQWARSPLGSLANICLSIGIAVCALGFGLALGLFVFS